VDDPAARQRARLRRRADLDRLADVAGVLSDMDRLADVAGVLSDIDRQVADLQHRVTALLDGQII
jgi:hypothetical protein